LTPFWIEFCFWGIVTWLAVLTILGICFATTALDMMTHNRDRIAQLREDYIQHREANRKALRALRKRVAQLEQWGNHKSKDLAVIQKEGIINWGDLVSDSSDDSATSKSAF